MSVFLKIILVVQMLSALGMIGLILIQHGKGADMGAAFGSGSSGSLFGASGSANFMSRTTSILAAIFFVATLMLTYFGSARSSSTSSVLEGAAVTAPAPVVPAAPASPASQIPGNTPVAPATPAAATASTSPASVPTTTSPSNAAAGASQIPAK